MNRSSKKSIYLYLFLISTLVMLFATKSSPLYPFNDWTDANAFFTTGKSMFQGKILYKDLYEHKGPYLYVLHGLAWMVSNKSFLGVWLIEIIACYFFLLYSYRTIRLFCEKEAGALIPLFAAVVYASNHMRHGDSAEELCLPLLIYGLYVVLKAFKQQKTISDQELFGIGVTSGCVLWIKYTMLGFYLGWIIMPLIVMIHKREWKQIAKMFMLIGSGVMLSSVPVLWYFYHHEAFADLFTVYFYNNMFVYSGEKLSFTAIVAQTIQRLGTAVSRNTLIFSLSILGGIWLLIKKEYKALLHVLFTVVGLIFTIIVPGTLHGYYTMCFSIYGGLGICAIWNIFARVFPKNIKQSIVSEKSQIVKIALLFGCMIGIVYFMGYNSHLLLDSKEVMPQYKFAKIIEQEENPTLLNYGCLDGGFYTVTGIVPNCKYFHTVNMELTEMEEMQNEFVEQGKVKFIVTRNQEYEWPLYEKVAEAEWPYENKHLVYYLYRLK